MTDATHTKGPWATGQGMFDAILAHDDSLICRLSSVDYRTGQQLNRSNGEDLANARLIAAAPELLEALLTLTGVEELTDQIWEIAHAAINKAMKGS